MFIRARARGIRVCYDHDLVGTHNDWAGTTLRDFCRRQWVYCGTAPLLRKRFGDELHPWSALIRVNSAPQRADGYRLIVRKRIKSLLSTKLSMAALFQTADVLERVERFRALRWLVYRTAIAASMYGGYQEGMRSINDSLQDRRI